MTDTTIAAAPTPDLRKLSQLRLGLLWATSLAPLAFVALLLALRWPQYWLWINFEQTPMTSLEVAVMASAAMLALLAGSRAWLCGRPHAQTWWLLAAAFLFFALDDRFALHERLRDRFLAPHGVSVPLLPWVSPGDFVVMLYAAVGLLFLPRVWRMLGTHAGARLRLGLGMLVAVVAVSLDTIDLDFLSVVQQRLEQTVEECLELAAQVLFLQSFLCALIGDIVASHAHVQPAGSAVGSRAAGVS